MGDVFLDAFLDTLKILPFLLVMNFLIEFIEYRSKGLKANKILLGGTAPLIGASVGVVPQCGFSVVATELYSKRRIALGTLLAVYLATSDEALPIMLSSYEGVVKLWPIIVIKLCYALVVGYAVFGIEKLTAARTNNPRTPDAAESAQSDRHGDGDDDVHARIHGCHHHDLEESEEISDKSTKRQKAAWVWNVYIKHPLIHTATVLLYIFIVNVIFGIIVYYVGEDRLARFIGSTGYLQPVLSSLVGLIPNCASSVVITELYVVGGLDLGGAVAGLCVSAGIGYAVLAKQNRPVKDTVFVILLMYALSVALGIGVTGVMQACGWSI